MLVVAHGPAGQTRGMSTDEDAMGLALAQARDAGARGDVPVGAVLLSSAGKVLAAAGNRRQLDGDPTAHAEILALRAAGVEQGYWRMSGCTLVVTLEPCTMCAGAIVLARVDRLVLGAWDEKAGACGSTRDVVRDSRLNHQVRVSGGVRATESTRLLTEFFAVRRGGTNEELPRPVG